MSQHTYYQAFPEPCSLFQRLRRDRAFHVLHTQLTLLGPGPFFLSQISPSEVGDTLAWLAAHEPAIASRAEAERLLGELRAAVTRAAACYPGIARRTAYFEQVQEEIDQVLVAELQRRGHAAATTRVAQLLYGADALAPDLFEFSELQWFLVPAGSVREGVEVLRPITPAVLDRRAGDGDLDSEAYRQWRKVYREAAKRGEVIAVLNS